MTVPPRTYRVDRRDRWHLYALVFLHFYTQTKKTTDTENIPGMCVLTNHMRDLVTAENEWVLSHGIELVLELFWKTSKFHLQLHLTEIESAIPFYPRATRTTQGKIGLSAFGEWIFRQADATISISDISNKSNSSGSHFTLIWKNCNCLPPNSPIDSTADSIDLFRPNPSMPSSRACIIQRLVTNFEMTHLYTMFLKNNESRFRQSAAIATMQRQQATDHSQLQFKFL